ncbi:MAG: OadG family protein [Oscillospiraceae bacterium]|nr:OadG family protein [Oscillospiraceae bacterium]
MYIHPFLLAEVQEQLPATEEVRQKMLQGTEKMSGTEITAMTIVGLAVVFAALLILVIFLYCSGTVFKKTGKQKKSEPAKAAPAKPASQQPKQQPKAAQAPAAAEDDGEIIAAIMAAIAAMGAADGKAYRLRSVRQVTRGGSGRSVWAQAGLHDATKPF